LGTSNVHHFTLFLAFEKAVRDYVIGKKEVNGNAGTKSLGRSSPREGERSKGRGHLF